eukprot:518851_1
MANTYLLSCLENDTKQNPSKALPNSRMSAWIRSLCTQYLKTDHADGVVEPSTDGFRVSASFGKVWDNWVKWDKNKFYAKLTGIEENEDEEDEEEEEAGSDSMDE